MKTAKIGALFLVSVLALAGASAGYAMWSDELYIDGTVNTGTIGAEWSIKRCYDDEAENKQYSEITADIVEDTMYIIITNAYPCITYSVDFDVHCTGTILIHLYWDQIILPANFPGTITFPDLTGTQIHPGMEALGTITIHLDNTAGQGAMYTFTTSIVYHQYNEPYVVP